jgi:hypothetical protein
MDQFNLFKIKYLLKKLITIFITQPYKAIFLLSIILLSFTYYFSSFKENNRRDNNSLNVVYDYR